MKKILDIPYRTPVQPSQLLDLYLPDGEAFPAFVYFHGGGLEKGKRNGEKQIAIANELVQRGICFASVEYRMYPYAKYPDFLCDGAAAVAWVKENIASYGGDPDRVYIGGSSAGAYISMMLAFDKKYLAPFKMKPTDFAGFFHNAGQPTAHFNVLRERGIDSRRVIVDETSPLYYIGIDKEYPPMAFLVSDDDMKNRYEQTMLVISTMKHFGYDESKYYLKVLPGTHCANCKDPVWFADLFEEFLQKFE